MKPEYIAYSGSEFTIEWYHSEQGKSQALEYFEGLDKSEQRKLLMLFQLLGDFGRIYDKGKFNSEGDQMYAFKPIPHRFLCFFFTGKKIIITNAFVKKQQKLPRVEKEKALGFKKDFETRIKEGSYYE